MRRIQLHLALVLCVLSAGSAWSQFALFSKHDFDVPSDFLEYAKRYGYTHIIVAGGIGTGDPFEWDRDNIRYDWSGSRILFDRLKHAYEEADLYGLRFIPHFQIGGRWSDENLIWTNQRIQWNLDTAVVNGDTVVARMPESAPTDSGMDASFAALLEVIDSAYRAADVSYPLEYVHIGMDEIITRRTHMDGSIPKNEILIAVSAIADQDYIANNGDDAGAYYKLYADLLYRRVQAVQSILGWNVKTMIHGDPLDIMHEGGRESFAWTTSGRRTINNVTTADAAFEYNLSSVKEGLVVMPWQYEPKFVGNVYDADAALSYLADNSFYFVPNTAFDNTQHSASGFYPSTAEESNATSRKMMRNWVQAASQSQFDGLRLGYSAGTFLHDSMWTRPQKHNWFLILPELAKRAGFYPASADLFVNWTDYYDEYVDFHPSYASSYYTGHTYIAVGPHPGTKAILPANIDGGVTGDERNDLIVAWSDAGDLVLEAFKSDGYYYSWLSQTTGIGGIGAALKFFSGDFNGDGRTDIFQLWQNNENPLNPNRLGLQVYQSDGTDFSLIWQNNNMGAAEALEFLPGDMNGDGLIDLLHLWNSGGSLRLNVYASNTVSFQGAWSSGSTNLGGATAIRFFSADVDNDGRTDVYHVWDDSGRTAIEVYRSTGSAYYHFSGDPDLGGAGVHADYLLADINGDGRSDILQIWDNNGNLAVEAYMASGTSSGFSSHQASQNLGTFNSASQYRVVDVNADGNSDLMELYDNGSDIETRIYLSNGSNTLSYYTTSYLTRNGTINNYEVIDIDGNH